jgi:Ca2+/Na+ antiporter
LPPDLHLCSYSKCSYSNILLPGINLLPTWLLGIMWFLFLAWLFVGVMIISDEFVEAVEMICSLTKKVKRTDTNGNTVMVEEPVWNWAVANITLLATGTSAPEIFLSLIEAMVNLGE